MAGESMERTFPAQTGFGLGNPNGPHFPIPATPKSREQETAHRQDPSHPMSQVPQHEAIQVTQNVSVELIYQSQLMHQLVEKTRLFAKSSATVLLTGESGTGKELFAKLVHQHSHRASKKFVRVNCAALSDSLIESEFFGHERGAFTGAVERRIGRFEWADGGTLLLDEVSEIPIQLQAKLLRVLEENEFQRVGSNQDQKINVRVVATSNRDLQQAVEEGTFRNDLYHRLNVLKLEIPPLRQRAEDISTLAFRFIKAFSREAAQPITGISKSALRKLGEYSWPGNVRQLRNVIHRACVLANSSLITPDELPEFEQPVDKIPAWLMDLTLEDVERNLILANLKRFSNNKTQTARHLGVTARTLSNKMKLYREQGHVQ